MSIHLGVGILLDVSRSMQRCYRDFVDGYTEEDKPWAMSIFQVIADLIKNEDLTLEYQVFALAFGGKGRKMFDVLRTLDKLNKIDFHDKLDTPASLEHIDEFLSVLEENGGRTIRNWVDTEIIRKNVDDSTLILALNELKSNERFRNHFIQNILPQEARKWFLESSEQNKKVHICSCFTRFTQNVVATLASTFRKATEAEIREMVQKARPKLLEGACSKSILTAKEASRILKGDTDNQELTTKMSEQLYRAVKPFIFGNTPLIGTLKKSAALFSSNKLKEETNKLLFILSDGRPTDGTDAEAFKRDLLKQNVTIVCCYISKENVQHKMLHSKLDENWREGAKFLFNLSSVVRTDQLPCTILIKRGWTLDVENNETKLFMQVNHPQNIRDVCELAKDIVTNKDALSYLLVSVSLDLYINQNNSGLTASKQEGATCYANACATVLHLSMRRILGREGGYPDFHEIRKELINLYGKSGAVPLNVLQEVCPKYRLRCKKAGLKEAKEAITKKRPVVALFRQTKKEKKKFDRFFARQPTGILTKKRIDITKREGDEELSGHAVVLTSYDSKCLRLMNSWGESWGDNGFFRIQSADVLDLKFIDVYWTTEDLSDSERAFYKMHGSTVAKNLVEKCVKLNSSTYKCPLCKRESPVDKFEGTLHRSKCPKCQEVFQTEKAGNILALNIYLSSLER